MDKNVVIIVAVVLFAAGCGVGYIVKSPDTEIEYVETVKWNNNTIYENYTIPEYYNNTEWVNNTYPVYNNYTEWINNTYPEYINNTEWINNTYYIDNGTTDDTTVTTPAGSWTSMGAITQFSGKITFGAFTENVNPTDIKLYVYANGSVDGNLAFPGPLGSQATALTWTPIQSVGATAEYFDYNYAGNLINSGDYITLSGLSPGTTYSFIVYHLPSDAIVSMTGASGQFSTPP